MAYWLMKTEPNVYSIEDLAREGTTHWEGVRNYQARNFMRDKMKIGDDVLFYHSNTTPPGIVGLAKISSGPYPDFTAWDKKSKYYDPKSSEENPRWMMVDVAFSCKFTNSVSLDQLKKDPVLEGILVAKRGMRLSIQPVEEKHYRHILNLGNS